MKILSLVCILFTTLLLAQNTGTLTGTVTDKESGETIAGAFVMLKDTSVGAASSVKGEYTLPDIPPGIYSVVSRMIGYTTITLDSIVIVADSTTVVDIAMPPTTQTPEK